MSRSSLSYLVQNSRIKREIRGIYRISQIPATQYDAMHLALLWVDSDNAILSHDTALCAWDISDINPTKIHVTVPKGHRISKAGGNNLVIHQQNILKRQIGWWEQMPITKLPLTIEQCIDRGVSSHLVTQAIENGYARGLLPEKEVKQLLNRLDLRNEKQ